MRSVEPTASVHTAPTDEMGRIDLGDVQLEVEVRGSGEPVLLVHAALLADWFRPLLTQT